MSKKKISVICMDPLAATAYATDIRSLFGDVAQVDTFSIWDGTATGMLPPADIYAAPPTPTALPRSFPAMFPRAARRWESRSPSAGRR